MKNLSNDSKVTNVRIKQSLIVVIILLAVLFVGRFAFSPPSITTIDQACQVVLDGKNLIDPRCSGESFNLEGRSAHFVMVFYGMQQDCPAGCFSSYYCAIVDQDSVYPYNFAFYNEEDDILDVMEGPGKGCYLGYQCKDKLSGHNHEITKTLDFKKFKVNEIDDLHGMFRACSLE